VGVGVRVRVTLPASPSPNLTLSLTHTRILTHPALHTAELLDLETLATKKFFFLHTDHFGICAISLVIKIEKKLSLKKMAQN
jgi:hypothetical protein